MCVLPRLVAYWISFRSPVFFALERPALEFFPSMGFIHQNVIFLQTEEIAWACYEKCPWSEKTNLYMLSAGA